MDIFHQIAVKIIKEQESIIGKLAWGEIKNIPGIVFVDTEHEEIQLSNNKQEAINNLVAHFNRLFGKASYEISYAAVEDLLQQLPPDEVPSSLREENVAIEKITEDLYKRNIELAAKNEVLIKLRTELENSNESLQKANKKLLKLDEAKDDFINIASHQLKSPITIIDNALEVVEGTKKFDEEMILTARKQARRLDKIITEILLASKLTTNKYRPQNIQPVRIAEVIQKIATERNFVFRDSAAVVTFHSTNASSCTIDGDELYLVEAFSNIIENAIKYSSIKDHKPKVDIVLSVEKNLFQFVCSDNGVGIRRADLLRLFGKFERGENVRKVSSGSGLGLYITKEIIEGHGGTIKIESELDRGTTVKISLTKSEG